MAVNTFVFMGRPGSGKGTQAKLLADSLGFDYFSTGILLRKLREEDPVVGPKIADTIDHGNLMPHWFASHLVVDKLLTTPANRGIVFDGSNRTLPEAELFFEVLSWIGREYRVVYLDVSEQTLVTRIHARLEEGKKRDDDATGVIANRIHEYDVYTAAALAFHRAHEKVIEVNGEETVEKIAAEINQAVAPLLTHQNA